MLAFLLFVDKTRGQRRYNLNETGGELYLANKIKILIKSLKY